MIALILSVVFAQFVVLRGLSIGAQNGNQNNNEDDDHAAYDGIVHTGSLLQCVGIGLARCPLWFIGLREVLHGDRAKLIAFQALFVIENRRYQH